MNEQCLCRIADRWTRYLRIAHDLQCHRNVRRPIHIDVADPGSRLDHRNAAVLDNPPNESGSAARNQHIEQARQMRHDINGGPILHREQLNRPGGNARSVCGTREHLCNRPVGSKGI